MQRYNTTSLAFAVEAAEADCHAQIEDYLLSEGGYWLGNHGLRYPDNFHEATKLHKNYHTDIKNDAKNDMSKDTLMAICVGCKFDLRMTQRVLEKQKFVLDEFQEPDKTYITLLERLPGLSIAEFNEILQRRNLKELGSRSNNKKS